MRFSIDAIIFDMDGLLIDSEPIWREVEVRIFESLGVPITYESSLQTMGLRCDAVTQFWYDRFPWTGKRPEEVTQDIVERVIETMKECGEPMPGAVEAVAAAKQTGKKVAIASSSPDDVIQAVVARLGIQGLDLTYSAEHEKNGKPHPDVYITTAKLLGVTPVNCVAIEDSINGARAAKAAGMTCIAIPDLRYSKKENFDMADYIFSSLKEMSEEIFIM